MRIKKYFFDIIFYGVVFLIIACGFGYLIQQITVPGVTQ